MKYIYNNQGEYIAKTWEDISDDDILQVYKNSYITNRLIEYPKLVNGKIVSKNKLEIEQQKYIDYKNNNYLLKYNELIDNETIKEVKLLDYEYIKNNKILYKLDEHKSELLRILDNLKTREMEQDILFKGAYQRNRELDRNNIIAVLVGMQATNQTTFNYWKMKDNKGNDKYIALTIQELQQLGLLMQAKVTSVMLKESKLRDNIKALNIETIKQYNIIDEYNKII